MKKILTAIFLMLTLTILIMSSCNKKENNAQNNILKDTVTGTDNLSETTGRIEPNLPVDANYNDYTFNIMVSGNIGTDTSNDFHSEADTGDVIPDAIYLRNITVEDKLGIKINAIPVPGNGDGLTAFRKSVLAQDNAYDAAMLGGYASGSLATQGLLQNLNSVPWLDFSQSWWDQKAVKDLTIKDKLYFMTGDFDTAANMDWTYCILFNKNIVQDYDLENLYELVKSGEWTIDKFGEMTRKVSKDLNGDGKMDKNDLYGALIWDDSMMGIVNAAGEKCSTVNTDGELEMALYTPKVLDMFVKYTNIVFNKDIAYGYQRAGEFGEDMFSNDQALFTVKTLFVVSNIRSMETDFGILPYFKLNEEQTEYYNAVSAHFSRFLCVPVNQSDAELERTGAIMEAIAAESHYTVKPAYYDRSLKTKYSRDEDSSEMLDIIFSTRTYDLGWIYQIGAYNEQIMNLFRNYKSDFSSMYDKNSNRAAKDIEKINTAFSQILD